MKKSYYFIQMLVAASIMVVLSIVYQRSLTFVLSYISLIIMLLFWLLPTIFVYGVSRCVFYFKIAFEKNSDYGDKTKAIRYFNAMTLYSILSSITVSIAMICYYLGNLDDTLGRFLEIALLTPTYSIFFSMIIFLPLRFSIENNLE